MTGSSAERLGDAPGFRRFWTASTVSGVGGYVSAVALSYLVVVTLHGSGTEVGLVTAARWLPYLLLGALVGVWADRVRRRPVLVGTDLGRTVLLAALPVLYALGLLSIPAVAVIMALVGLLSVAGDAVHQSFLPRLLPRPLLGVGNARLLQSDAVAQSGGPALAGLLVGWLGAPLAFLVDATTYLTSGLLTLSLRIDEPRVPRPPGSATQRLVAELRDGLRWVYGRRQFAAMALTSHLWFLFWAVLGVGYPIVALRSLGLGSTAFGLTLALTGVGGLVGASLSLVSTRRLSLVVVVAGSSLLQAVGFVIITLAPVTGSWTVVLLPGLGQLLSGFGLGWSSPVELAWRQLVTPDRLLGRVNATVRSTNRAMLVIGAPLGGLLIDQVGARPALWVGIGGITLSAVLLLTSTFRHASLDDEPPDDHDHPS